MDSDAPAQTAELDSPAVAALIDQALRPYQQALAAPPLAADIGTQAHPQRSRRPAASGRAAKA